MSVPEHTHRAHAHGGPKWHLAECLLPGFTTAAATGLIGHLEQAIGILPDQRVAFLGSLLILENEVLLCLFSGCLDDIGEACYQARLPFERIVACTWLG
jgi:hypothetical protein